MAAMVSVASSALAQQGYDAQAWDKIVAAAKKEGKVVYYAGMGPAPLGRLMAGFKKAYPDITVDSSIQSSGEQLTRVQQERATKVDGADMWSTVDQNLPIFTAWAKEGGLLKPVGPAMKEWPAASVREGTIPFIGIEPRVIAYNKDLVKTPPQTWLDVLNPEFRGKIGTVDSSATAYIAFYDFIEKSTRTPDFLEKLKAHNPKLYASAIPLGQAVASGEIAIDLFAVPSVLSGLIQKGAPIAYSIPNPNLGVYYIGGAFSWAKRPNAALVLLDYIMSRDGQTAWHGTGDSSSTLQNIPGAVVAAGAVRGEPVPKDYEDKYRARFMNIFR